MSEPRSPTVADIGEFGVIAALRERLGTAATIEVGPGDDAAVVAAPDARVVVSTDTLIDRTHFRTDWASGYEIGRRASATSLVDICAMGATPTALVVALSVPPSTEVDWVMRLADGLSEEAQLVGAVVVGGDLTRSQLVSITVTALGGLAGRPPVLRSGATAGDVVAVCGRLGWAEAGLAVLSRGFSSPRVLVDAYRRPQPPYGGGPAAAIAGASAMADVSDGLLSDLGHICEASGVSANIESAVLDVADPVAAVAAAFGTDPLTWVLTGGQDHALVATFAAGAQLPSGFVQVGEIVERKEEQETWVLVDGALFEGPTGHRHF